MLRLTLSLALLALSANLPAHAEDYPTRPVKIISDSAPGSAVDVTLRLVADRLSHIWGQQVLPVNQPGAGGAISARVAAEAAPDGYTLYMPALSVFLPSPGKAANTAFELPRDFAPIGSLTEQPMFVARLTVELVRPVPLAPLTMGTTLLRPGRRVQLVAIR